LEAKAALDLGEVKDFSESKVSIFKDLTETSSPLDKRPMPKVPQSDLGAVIAAVERELVVDDGQTLFIYQVLNASVISTNIC
jgi:hypothetical protein